MIAGVVRRLAALCLAGCASICLVARRQFSKTCFSSANGSYGQFLAPFFCRTAWLSLSSNATRHSALFNPYCTQHYFDWKLAPQGSVMNTIVAIF
jgi:hypothetical protein